MSFIRPALIASKQVGGPVKIIWSREEDMAHGMMRPAAATRIRSGLNQVGLPVVWDQRLSVPSVSEQLAPARVRDGVDQLSVHGADDLQYTFPHHKLEYAMPEAGVPLGFWRSVPHSYNAFFIESFVDEIAAASKRDPAGLRRELMADRLRNIAVLDKLIETSGWNVPPAEGIGRGIAVYESFGSICGQVVEVSLPEPKKIKLERVISVIDCGVAVNPRTIEAQIEGSIVYALTAAMFGKITVEGGAAVQRNFDTYQMMHLRHTPPIEVHIMENGPIGGIGEPGVPPLAPALVNAVFAVSGERLRKLPLADLGYTYA